MFMFIFISVFMFILFGLFTYMFLIGTKTLNFAEALESTISENVTMKSLILFGNQKKYRDD
jgi:hypothetical protein